jgi:hypothetical protein
LEAVVLTDVPRAQEVLVEMALLQARGQARANKRAAKDPELAPRPGLALPLPGLPGAWNGGGRG